MILVWLCLGSGTFHHGPVGQVESIGALTEEVPEGVEALAVGKTDALGIRSHLIVSVLVIGGVIIGSVEHLSAQPPVLGDFVVKVEIAYDASGIGGIGSSGTDDSEVGLNSQPVVEELFAHGHGNLFVAHLTTRLVVDINVDIIGELRKDVVKLVGEDVIVTAACSTIVERVENHEVDGLDEHFGLVGGIDHVKHGLFKVFGGVGQPDAEGDVRVE